MSGFNFVNDVNVKKSKIDPQGKVTGLWIKKDENGDDYLQGDLGNYLQVRIYENKYKQDDKHPDFNLCFIIN